MGLMDRDWYRTELAQRERRLHRRKWLDLVKALAVVLVIVNVMFAAAPILLDSRCDLDEWRAMPVACWRWSATVLIDRVAANMAAKRKRVGKILRY